MVDNLQNNERTGFLLSGEAYIRNSRLISNDDQFTTPTPLWSHNNLIPEYEIPISRYFKYEFFFSEQPKEDSIRVQIENLRRKMGLNISEIAEVLFVTRPTIYEWLGNEDAKLHSFNQQRLNLIYELFLIWDKKNIGRIGSNYFHKMIMSENKSLFMLLTEEELNKERICNVMNQIQELKEIQNKNDELRKTFLQQHGFEEVSKEAREDNLNKFIRNIGLNERNSNTGKK